MNHLTNQLGKKIQNYIFNYSDFLGAGNFSKCYKGVNQLTNEIVAIKIVQLNSLKSKKLQELLFQQIQILKKLNHPTVLKCYEIFTSNRNCYIITELCDGGNLENKLKLKGVFDQYEANHIIKDVYNGLLYLAHNNIVHRDFKSANIFLQNGRAKIADFGFAKEINHNFKDFNIGSPLYMSPQGILHNVYGPKTQVWALGIFVYELFHGTTPFNYCKTEDDLKRSVMTPLNWNQLRPDIAADIKQFILTCLEVNEEKRITIEQLSNLNYMRRISQIDTFNINNMEVRSPSKSTHFAIKKINQIIPVESQRVNNNFRPIQNVAIRENSEQRSSNNKVLYLSIDKRNNFHNNTYSSPKRGMIPSANGHLGSPNRTMTLNPNYMNQNNNPLLLKSIREVEMQDRQRKSVSKNEQPNNIKLQNPMMTSQNNQNQIIHYQQQQQNKRPLSHMNSFASNSQNYSTTLNNNQMQSLGYNTFAGRFYGQSNNNENSLKNIVIKIQPSSTHQIENNLIIDRITFREAIFFIHHCRLLYKFLQIYKDSAWFQENLYIKVYKYLLTVLSELRGLAENQRIQADGQKSSNKIKKLSQVTIQYFNKYQKKTEEHGYSIDPEICPDTNLPSIRQLISNLFSHLNNEIYNVSRKNFLNVMDENLIILGHLVIIIKSSLSQIEKAISSRNYKLLGNFKQIEVVLNTSREEFTCSSYRKYREKFITA